ncbi:MAG: psd [Deltaproteobacteria bacterium]|nr:psd [Deltaproteobacteria bacterium]
MRIAREGYPLVLTAGIAALVVLVIGWVLLGGLMAVLTVAVAAFFRDPERVIPAGDSLIVSPADGKVVSVAPAAAGGMFDGAATRVSIFLSPLDVHINRVPVAGKIDAVQYQRGEFLAAYKADASERNEQNALKILCSGARFIGVVQIAGVLARRIVCRVKRGDDLKRGDRFGLIMFGSRTDTYLPNGCSVEVVEGQRVKGGETIIGRFV